jgi:hypothetical protein
LLQPFSNDFEDSDSARHFLHGDDTAELGKRKKSFVRKEKFAPKKKWMVLKKSLSVRRDSFETRS